MGVEKLPIIWKLVRNEKVGLELMSLPHWWCELGVVRLVQEKQRALPAQPQLTETCKHPSLSMLWLRD